MNRLFSVQLFKWFKENRSTNVVKVSAIDLVTVSVLKVSAIDLVTVADQKSFGKKEVKQRQKQIEMMYQI